MKAIRINAPGEVEICEVEMPVRKPGEALLKLLYGGIAEATWVLTEGHLRILIIPGFPDMSSARRLWR